jgi:hypothetical protein
VADLLAVSDGLVFVEDGMFCLIDASAPGHAAHSSPPAPPGGLVIVGAALGLATFISGFQDNEPYVRLEYWSARPPEPDGAWEATFRSQLQVPSGTLTLASGVSMLGSSHELALPPGDYHLAVWCRGRASLLAGARDAIDAGVYQRGVEQWLIRLWAA